MATKRSINTRIQLKYSTLEEWSNISVPEKGGNLILNKGEVGIVAIPSESAHLQTTPPAIMFKVGDGKTPFKNLPWASALAADVYAWAKKSAPSVEDFGNIIEAAREGLISADAVVKTLNELKGDVTIATATGETHITVAKDGQKITFALNLSDAETAALSSGITATKVSKYDGYEALITEAKNQADKGVSDAAAAQATANAAVTKTAFGEFQTTNTAAIADAKKAGTDAQVAAEAAQTTANAALPQTDFNSFKTTNSAAIADAKKAGTDAAAALNEYKTTNDTAVQANATAISNLQTAIRSGITFKGKLSELPEVTSYSNGDLIIVNTKEYILFEDISEHTKNWIELGDEGSHLTKATADGYYVPLARTIADVNLQDNITKEELQIALNVADGATNVVESTVEGWGFTKNKGTVITVKMNGEAKSTSADGVVDLGTIITEHQSLDGKQDKLTSNNKLSVDLISGLATVATSGSYNDLADKPTINNNNQTVKVGEVTFGENAAVEFVAGTNVTVIAETVDGANKIHINGKSDADINTLITNKINGLDVSNISGFGAGKTLQTLTETNGKIAATFQDISVTASQVSDFDTKVDARINNHVGVDKVGTVTSVGAGIGLKITGTASVAPVVDIDDSVVFILDCGSATVTVD